MQLQRKTPHRLFVTMTQQKKEVACASVVFQQNIMGIYDVTVAKELRNQGIGTKLIQTLLTYAYHNQIEEAYLAVLKDNKCALHTYEKVGFQMLYQYWYRVKN